MLRLLITLFFIGLTTILSGCSSSVSGLQNYVNTANGYQFLYPNGWIPVNVKNASSGVDVVFSDLVERTENLSVIISDVPEGETLEDLGTPTEVGYRFLKAVNGSQQEDKETEFIAAGSRQDENKTYYLFEYDVTSPEEGLRHNLSSVAVSHGKLYTFNISTIDRRWQTVKDTFEVVAKSFSVR